MQQKSFSELEKDCGKKHHTTLHEFCFQGAEVKNNQKKNRDQGVQLPKKPAEETWVTANCLLQRAKKTVFLSIVCVTLHLSCWTLAHSFVTMSIGWAYKGNQWCITF